VLKGLKPTSSFRCRVSRAIAELIFSELRIRGRHDYHDSHAVSIDVSYQFQTEFESTRTVTLVTSGAGRVTAHGNFTRECIRYATMIGMIGTPGDRSQGAFN